MPYLRLPDGRYLAAKEGETEEAATARAQARFPDLYPVDTSGAREGVMAQIGSGMRGIGTGAGYLKDLAVGASDEEIRKRQKAAERENQEKVKGTSMDEVRKKWDENSGIAALLSAGAEFGTLTKETMAQSLPAMGSIAGGARLGVLAAAPIPIPGARIVGGLAGAVAGAFPTQIEQMLGRHTDESKPIDRGAALAGAAASSVLDVAEQIFVLGKLGVGKGVIEPLRKLLRKGTPDALKKAEEKLFKEANRSLKASIGRGAVRGVVSEVPVEVAQSVIERAQAGMPLLDAEAIKEYQDTAATMVGPGALFGGVGGVSSRSDARSRVDKIETARKAEEYMKEQVATKATEDAQKQQELLAMGPQSGGPLFGQTVQGEDFQITGEGLPPQTFGALPQLDVPQDLQAKEYEFETRGGAKQTSTIPAQSQAVSAELQAQAQELPRQQSRLKSEADRLQQAAATEPDPAKAAALADQHLRMKTTLKETNKRISELKEAGIDVTPLANLQETANNLKKQLQVAQDQGDMEKVSVLGKRVAAINTQVSALQQQLPDTAAQPDLFAEAAREDKTAAIFDKEQAALQKQQAQLAKKQARTVDAWKGELDKIATQRGDDSPYSLYPKPNRPLRTEAEAAEAARQEEIAGYVESEDTTPLDRRVKPVEPVVEEGRVVGEGYSYPAEATGADIARSQSTWGDPSEALPGPIATSIVPARTAKTATRRYQRLIEAVDAGDLNTELAAALGVKLPNTFDFDPSQGAPVLGALDARRYDISTEGTPKQQGAPKVSPPQALDLKTPAGAVAALGALDARAAEVKGILESVDPDTMTSKDASNHVRTEAVLKDLRRLQDMARTTLREQPRDLGVDAKLRTTGVNATLTNEKGKKGLDTAQPSAENLRRADQAVAVTTGELGEFRSIVDDLRKGAFFGGPNPIGASSTLEGMEKRGAKAIEGYTDGLLAEVAYRRAAKGLPEMTPTESVGAASQIKQRLTKIVKGATNFAGKIKHDQFEIDRLTEELKKELAKLEKGGGTVAQAIARARGVTTQEFQQRGIIPGGELETRNPQIAIAFEKALLARTAAELKNVRKPAAIEAHIAVQNAKKRGASEKEIKEIQARQNIDKVRSIQRRINGIEKMLGHRLKVTNVQQVKPQDKATRDKIETRRLLVEAAMRDAVGRGAPQATLDRLQAQMKIVREKSIPLGVRDEEAAGWNRELGAIRKRLLNVKRPWQVSPVNDEIRTLMGELQVEQAKSPASIDAALVKELQARIKELNKQNPLRLSRRMDIRLNEKGGVEPYGEGRSGAETNTTASSVTAYAVETRKGEKKTSLVDTSPVVETGAQRTPEVDPKQRNLFKPRDLPTVKMFQHFLNMAAAKKQRAANAQRVKLEEESKGPTKLLHDLNTELYGHLETHTEGQPPTRVGGQELRILDAIRELVRRMYPVRQQIQKALVHELPTTVRIRLLAEANRLVSETLPGLDASIAELEASQTDVARVQEEVKQLYTEAKNIERVYKTPRDEYNHAWELADKAIKTEEEYLKTLEEGIAETRVEINKRTQNVELIRRRQALAQAKQVLTEERNAAAALDRALRQKIDERFGLTTIQRTAEIAETINKETGEKVIIKTKAPPSAALETALKRKKLLQNALAKAAPESSRAKAIQKALDRVNKDVSSFRKAQPLHKPLTRTLRPISTAEEITRLNEAAKTAATERSTDHQNLLRTLTASRVGLVEEIARRKAETEKLRKQLEVDKDNLRKWATDVQNTDSKASSPYIQKVQAGMPSIERKIAAQEIATSKLEKALQKINQNPLFTTTDALRGSAAATAKANTKAIGILRALGELPERSAPSYAGLRTGSEAQRADRDARRDLAKDTREQRKAEGPGTPELNFDDDVAPDGTAFRTGSLPAKSVDGRLAAHWINKAKSKLQKSVADAIEYYPSLSDMTPEDAAFMQKGLPEGKARRGAVLPNGRVLIVGEAHESLSDLQETFSHELWGHYGPDVALGPKGFKSLSDAVWRDGEAGVRALAKELGIEGQIDAIIAGDAALREWLKANPGLNISLAPDSAKLAITREIVADAATYSPPPPRKGMEKVIPPRVMRVIRQIVNAVRQFLFGPMGMEAHARATTQQIYDSLRQSQNAFESKNMGPYRAPTGAAAFRTGADPAFDGLRPIFESIVGSATPKFEKSKMSIYGLAAEVQMFDSAAALSKAVQAGLVAKGLKSTDLQWAQTMTWVRAYQDIMHHTTDVLSNGAKQIVTEKAADGRDAKTYGVGSKGRGVSMSDVIKPLKVVSTDHQDAGLAATYYGIMRRADRVGWNKVNLGMLESEASKKKFYDNRDTFKKWLKDNPAKEAALAKWFDLYQQYNGGLLDMLAESQALPSGIINALKAQLDYIPFYRINPKNANAVEMFLDEGWKQIGDLTHQPYLQQLVGGDERILNFFESSIQNTQLLIEKTLSNQAGRVAASTMVDLGLTDGGVRHGYGPADANSIRFNVEPSAEEFAEKGHDAGQRHVLLNTEAVGIPSNLVVHGLRGSTVQMPAALRILGIPGAWVRKWVTRSPMYALRQLYSDVPSLLFTSGASPNLAKVLGNIQKSFAGTNPVIARLQEMGLLGGNIYTGTKEDLERVSRALSSEGDANMTWDKAMAALDKIGIGADSFSRAHIFQSLREKGMTEMEAAIATRDALDFSRRGVSPSVRMAASIMPFMNTQMQALYALVRAARGTMPYNERLKLQQKFWQRGLLMAAAATAYAMAMQDDEAYKNASPYERYYYWFVRVPGLDEPLRIRVPFEAGIVFKAVPEALYQLGATDTTATEALGGLGKAAWNSNPYNIPPTFKTMIEQAYNIQTYSGQPLEDARMQKLEPVLRYRRNTTDTAKGISKGMQELGLPVVSPVRIENLINNFTTGSGLALLSLFDPVVRAMQEEVAGPVEGRKSDIPVFGKAFQRNDATGLVNSAYDIAKDLDMRVKTFNKYVEDGHAEQAKAYAEKYGREIALGMKGGPAPAFRMQMDKLKKIERAIEAAAEKTISPARKRELLDNLHKAQREIAGGFRSAILSAGT